MATIIQTERQVLTPEVSRERIMRSGSSMETLGGIAMIGLAIAGLAGGAPVVLGAIAALVGALAMLWQGGYVSWRQNFTEAIPRRVWTSMVSEFLAGAAGIIFSVLALSGVRSTTLTAVTGVLYALGAIAIGSATSYVADYVYVGGSTAVRERPARSGGVGLAELAAVAGGFLGIWSLSQAGGGLALSLWSMLCIGLSLFFGGIALGGAMHVTR